MNVYECGTKLPANRHWMYSRRGGLRQEGGGGGDGRPRLRMVAEDEDDRATA